MPHKPDISFTVNKAGDAQITIKKATWDKMLKKGAQAMHLDRCAHVAWKKGNHVGALIFHDRNSNGPLAQMFMLLPANLQKKLRAIKGSNEGK